MQTQAEFVAERLKTHREACAGLDDDPLYKMATGAHEPAVISPLERSQYCYPEGFMFRRQAG